MLKGIQNKLEMIGKYGCYFLCLIHSFDEKATLDKIVEYYDLFIKNRWLTKDCEVLDAQGIANKLSGKKVAVVKSKTIDYKANVVIIKWYNPKTGFTHFTTKDFDPLENSKTVAEGYQVDYRMFYYGS